MTGMYLEHYGVKGMKWGVRKEYEPSPRKTASNKTDHKNTGSPRKSEKKNGSGNTIYQTFSNSTLQNAYESYLSAGKQNFDYLQEWGKADDSKWDEAYAKAAEGFSDLERAMMVAYQMLVKYNLTGRFEVCLKGKANDKNPTICFYDNQQFESVDTLAECRARARTSARRREKNVQGEPVAIKVNKGKSTGGKPSASTTVSNSTIQSINRAKQTDQMVNTVKDLMKTIGKKKMSNTK